MDWMYKLKNIQINCKPPNKYLLKEYWYFKKLLLFSFLFSEDLYYPCDVISATLSPGKQSAIMYKRCNSHNMEDSVGLYVSHVDNALLLNWTGHPRYTTKVFLTSDGRKLDLFYIKVNSQHLPHGDPCVWIWL